MNVRIVTETSLAITLGWDPVSGAEGFIYTLDGSEKLADGKRHFTLDGTKTSVKLAKPQDGQPHTYGVAALGVVGTGTVTTPTAAPAPPPAAPYHLDDFQDGTIDTSWLVLWTGTEQVVTDPLDTSRKALRLRTVSNTAGSGAPNSQMACVYTNPPYAHGSEGQRTFYRADMLLPAGFTPTPGQWNWLVEWHISDAVPQNVAGSRAASCALGIWSNFTDRNTGKAYGLSDYVLVMRVEGGDPANPYGSDANAAGTYHVLGPLSTFAGRWAGLVFDYTWTINLTGSLNVLIDGKTAWTYTGPTLFKIATGSDQVGFGLYNYHPAVAYQSDVYFRPMAVGPTLASVGS